MDEPFRRALLNFLRRFVFWRGTDILPQLKESFHVFIRAAEIDWSEVASTGYDEEEDSEKTNK